MISNNDPEKHVLIIGGGVAGISAALDLADQGQYVYLIEKSPSIGGKMAQLDKTFPTLDCSICILAPKMVECARHHRINLFNYSEVTKVESIHNDSAFKVKILKKPRYVDENKCTSCGDCAEICPVMDVPNEFEVGLKNVHAAYIPFLQAVPSVYLIDKNQCLYLNYGICGLCYHTCKAEAIDFNQKPEEIEIEVASIIIATGFDLMDISSLKRYGHGIYPNVVTSLEYERIMCASGPTNGEILRPFDNKHPHRIGFILCVGSRNIEMKPYCSKICCMYATKEAIMTMEHHPDAELLVYYNDLRTIGKNHNEFIERAKDDYNVHYIKGLPNKIYENPETKDLIIRSTDFEKGEVKLETVDMIVLFPAVIPSRGTTELSEILNVETDDFGFIKPFSISNNLETNIPGIYVCGCAHGPEDISTSVAEALGAASKAIGRTSITQVEEIEEEIIEIKVLKDDPPRIGVFVCHCGSNIAGFVDVEEVANYIQYMPDVVYVERNLYTCSEESQNNIKNAIKKYNLNRVIIASCSPRTHLPLFQGTCREAGLNPYLVEFASIRELVSWVHMNEPEKATKKATEQIKMAIAKARLVEPLYDFEVNVLPSCLVIGGGIAGMTASLAIAKKGFKVYLIEKDNELGGFVRKLTTLGIEGISSDLLLNPIIQDIGTNQNIEIFTNSTVQNVGGSIGNFRISIDQNGIEKEIEVGTIIVAVGGQEYKPNGYYLYNENNRVYTNLEFEDLIRNKKIQDKESIGFIQCVGSREKEGRTFCSLTCCGESIKNALALKESYPKSQIFILYRDIRVSYEEELRYRRARGKGINFIQYKPEKTPTIIEAPDDKIRIYVNDSLTRKDFELTLDRLVLATPLITWEENKSLSEMLKVPLDKNGFFLEAHPKLRPVDFATDGIFICGTAQSPKNVLESISQALGAASRALIPLMNGKAVVEGAISEINQEACIGCEICVKLCPYNAISKKDEDKVIVNKVLCKGCGICAASCPEKAITLHHFTSEQILSQITSVEESKEEEFEPKILGFLCNWCSYAGADLAGVSRIQYSPNLRVIRVMCSGRVDPLFIVEAFLNEIDGILVLGCHLGDCHYISGNYEAEIKMNGLLKLLGLAGLSDRLRLDWVSASEGVRFGQLVDEFTNHIRKLGPSPIKNKENNQKTLENLNAIKSVLSDSRIRALFARERLITSAGNVYNEVIPEEDFEDILESAIENEFIRQKILEIIKEKGKSVPEISNEINLEPNIVLNHIITLRSRGLVDLEKITKEVPTFVSIKE
ncbi:MAG: hydrogenase iron-sulfur subunit [Promethearchaeota archaeon]